MRAMSPRILVAVMTGALLLAGRAGAQFTEEQQRQALAVDDFLYRNRLENDRRYREQQRQQQLRMDDDRRRWNEYQNRTYQRQVQEREYARQMEDYRRQKQAYDDALRTRVGLQHLYLKSAQQGDTRSVTGSKAPSKVRAPVASRASKSWSESETALTKVKPRSAREVERFRKQLVQEHLRQLEGAGPRAKKRPDRRTKKKRDDDDDD